MRKGLLLCLHLLRPWGLTKRILLLLLLRLEHTGAARLHTRSTGLQPRLLHLLLRPVRELGARCALLLWLLWHPPRHRSRRAHPSINHWSRLGLTLKSHLLLLLLLRLRLLLRPGKSARTSGLPRAKPATNRRCTRTRTKRGSDAGGTSDGLLQLLLLRNALSRHQAASHPRAPHPGTRPHAARETRRPAGTRCSANAPLWLPRTPCRAGRAKLRLHRRLHPAGSSRELLLPRKGLLLSLRLLLHRALRVSLRLASREGCEAGPLRLHPREGCARWEARLLHGWRASRCKQR